MQKHQLQETLAKLHGELSDREKIDDDTRRLLKKFADDINRFLDASTEAASADEVEPLSEQAQDLVLKFETDHPQLTAALNQVASALANMGI